jgi:hypothetical protein
MMGGVREWVQLCAVSAFASILDLTAVRSIPPCVHSILLGHYTAVSSILQVYSCAECKLLCAVYCCKQYTASILLCAVKFTILL